MSSSRTRLERRYRFEPPETESPNVVTSISVARSGEQICAGTTTGKIHIFERRVDGSWSKTLTWVANREIVDARLRKSISGIVLDTDIFTIDRKCPLLISAGFREIRLWSISDRFNPVSKTPFHSHGLEFPRVSGRERFVGANEISLIQSNDSAFFSSVRACQDGLTFAYTEEKRVIIRRVDHIEPSLTVYTNDNLLTRVDFHPTRFDCILCGDDSGFCNMVDMRIQPIQTTPTLRTDGGRCISDGYRYVNDCRFSPDGSIFFTRHFGHVMLWDLRNPAAPLVQDAVPPGASDGNTHLSPDGTDFFRSTWIAENEVATGWFGGEIFAFDTSGHSRSLTGTKTPKAKRLRFTGKKKQWAKEHCVHSVDVAPGGKRAAASFGGEVHIYDLESDVDS